LWYAGAAVAGGIFLFGTAVPAQAGRSEGLNVENPARHRTAGGLTSSPARRPAAHRTELFDGGTPLLGGLGGMPPPNALPRVPGVPDVSGLPAGGVAVNSAAGAPAATQPALQRPEPAVIPDDPRVHEEPIDGDATPTATPSTEPRREFSPNGRPVAGIDEQYR
jgi:hypothetical protein